MRIIGMARVSSTEQANGNALEQQIQRLKDYGATEIVSSIGSRSQQLKSEHYNYLINLMESEPHNLTIVVTRFDRIGTLLAIKKFVDTAVAQKVNLVALDQSIDLNTTMGRAFASLLGVVSDIEVEGLSDRVKHGHAYHQKRKAAYFSVFGYEKEGDKLVISHDPFICCDGQEWSKYAIARYRIELLLKTGSLNKTVKLYNEKFGLFNTTSSIGRGNRSPKGGMRISVGGFGNWLCNPILRGHLAYGRKDKQRLSNAGEWRLNLNTHEPIMSEDEWEAIERIMTVNIKKNGQCGNSAQRPFAGLVRCNECKAACTSASFKLPSDRTIRKYSYKCVKHRRNQGCSQGKGVREEKVRDAIIERLTQYANEIFLLERPKNNEQPIDPEVVKIESEISNLSKIPNPSSVITQAIEDLKQQIEKIKIQNQLKGDSSSKSYQELIEIFKDPIFWSDFMEQTLTPSEVRSYYQKWIRAIWIQDGEIANVELRF